MRPPAEHVHWLFATDSRGNVMTIKNAVCLHEDSPEPVGVLLIVRRVSLVLVERYRLGKFVGFLVDLYVKVELLHLFHLCLQGRRRLLAFAFARRLFGGEVQRHGVGTTVVSHPNAADDLGAEGGPLGRVLLHELPRAVRVATSALDDLDEAGGIGVASNVDGDVVAVFEGGLPGEQPRGLGPPSVLFGSVAVAPSRLLGLEAGQGDEAAVLGHPGGRAEPADGPGGELLNPPVERGPQLSRVGHLSLNHLNEHRDPPQGTYRLAMASSAVQMLDLLAPASIP